jgi:DNA repair protein RecO (recombination protein O)
MQVKDKVFILRKVRYGDADLILNCLNSRGSRLSFYARSALKSKKRFGGGVLEPTHYVQVVYEDKSGTSPAENPLHTLKEASLIADFPGVRTEYARIELALHFVRLISEIVRDGDIDSADLFNLLGNSLRAAETTSRLDRLRIHFEVKLLANQGVLPLEAEENELLQAAISAHETVTLSDEQWAIVAAQARRVLREYLHHTPA